MAENPKGGSGDFAKKVQRRLSRGKEKVLQRLGKTTESRDEQFEYFLLQFNDQQTDGNRIYKDLRNYINSVRDMREASRRVSQSLFDSYEADWAGEEDLAGITEGEDLLWNDFEVKLLDQAVRTMESYVGQFPDIREKVAKRGRKLVDYDSTLHHLEALQSAKKRDDVKIIKAEEEMHEARSVYESINSELKDELPVIFDSRVGCFVSAFSAVSHLRNTFFKEMSTLNLDLQSVIKELQAQHPEKVFAVKGLQRYGSLKRRTLTSPKAWKSSFSEFHKSYSPKPSRFSFRSPDKPRHSTLSRESSTSLPTSPQPSSYNSSPHFPPQEDLQEDLDAASNHNESISPPAEEVQQEEGKPEETPAEPQEEKEGKKEREKEEAKDSSSEGNPSCDSESLELQLSAAEETLHIQEEEEEEKGGGGGRGGGGGGLKENRLQNGDGVGVISDGQEVRNKVAEKPASPDSKSTDV
ncbi:bridging integrator 2a [Trematomus bernacchii]|uniref:bridging integrator 2a n=1 Tax=Trematomus bernacchii TaxID=40690 RepID=UPI00146B9F3B|nr:bridging integrator 2a [Trematomus bernacchii]